MAEIFLKYGLNDDGELIYIGQSARGKTALHCPYCAGLLIARKGLKVAAHFAHAGETCNQASRNPDVIALPVFDKFTLDLPGKLINGLRDFTTGQADYYTCERLKNAGLLSRNEFRREYVLTHAGKVVLGQLSLDLFGTFQEHRINEKHDLLIERKRVARGVSARLAKLAELAAQIKLESVNYSALYFKLIREQNELKAQDNETDYETASTDLRLYRAQWGRVLGLTLYFLEINNGQYHKIGVTARPVSERIEEIRRDLVPLLGEDVKIAVIKTFAHRGGVEQYFLYRYAAYHAELGALTEYFQFGEYISNVKRDLSRMRDKTLTDLEIGIVEGVRDALSLADDSDAIEARRRDAIKKKLRKRVQRGLSVGRPRITSVLDQPYAPAVIAALEAGLSLRKAAESSGVAVNTVRAVKAALDAKRSG